MRHGLSPPVSETAMSGRPLCLGFLIRSFLPIDFAQVPTASVETFNLCAKKEEPHRR